MQLGHVLVGLGALAVACAPFMGSEPEPASPALPHRAGTTLDTRQLAAAYRTLGLRSAGNGVLNDCDEVVRPDVHAAELGGAVGRAFLIVVGGGPESLTCYGVTGMAIYLLKPEGQGFRTLYSGVGHLVIMPTSHNGVRDILIGGPGLEFPELHWNGSAYQHGGTIPDSQELPPSLN